MPKKPKRIGKKAPKTQDHVAAGPSFLDLPAEVRNMIYRLLLVADQPLGSGATESEDIYDASGLEWAKFREYHLQPAILCTCRQVYQEARPLLIGENTIGIQIYGCEVQDSSLSGSCYFHKLDDFSDESNEVEYESRTIFMNYILNQGVEEMVFSRNLIACFQTFQRFEIVIDTANVELKDVTLNVENLCSILSDMSPLQHISLHLLEHPCRKNNHPTLGPFGILRNVRSVVICGVPLPFAERLKKLMLGNTPQENVKEMYRLLESYVKGPKGNISDLQKASKALQEWDLQMFKTIRSKILLDGQRCMEDALLHIGDYDQDSEEHYQAAFEENYEHKIAEDHDSKIGEDGEGKLGDH